MKENKLFRVFLVLVAAIFVTVGTTGWRSKYLSSDAAVIAKVKELARGETAQLGYDVEVRCVRDHIGRVGCFLFNLRHPSAPKFDEVWVTEIHSTKWRSCIVRLCRRGSYYFLNFNPQDMD